MEEVVVTATRDDENVSRLPANITVISREDIAKSGSTNLTEVLSTKGGLVVRGFLGNDKKAAVDIRGMGETSVSSVLVLVDGIRHNPSDMAGPDLSTVSLDQIERIEIIRGAGSVLYGDGAVGGVINIISTPVGRKNSALVKFEGGSYATGRATLRLNGSARGLHAGFIGNHGTIDGYRENGELTTSNADLKLEYDINDRLVASFRTRWHEDRYGFPGPLTLDQFKEDPRQSADFTRSHGNTYEMVAGAGLDLDLDRLGMISALVTYNDRENTWVMLLTPGEIHESTWVGNLKHTLEHSIAGQQNQIIWGVDLRHTDYSQGTSFAAKPYDLNHIGVYSLDRLTLRQMWILQAGYRHHRYDNRNRVSGGTTHWRADVITAGVVRLLTFGTNWAGSLFANYSTSFRLPDIDELGFATDNIRPQTGRHFDVGSKLRWKERVELNLTWFDIRIEDEIWFDASRYVNTNYIHPTRRMGIEAALRLFPFKSMELWTNYTYTKATFEGIDYNIPTVPEHKLSSGIHWQASEWLELGLTYDYVGSRPQGGNPIVGSKFEDMPAYAVWSTRWAWTSRRYPLTTYIGINNLLDTSYYSLSYYDNVYPSPTRSFIVGIVWEH